METGGDEVGGIGRVVSVVILAIVEETSVSLMGA